MTRALDEIVAIDPGATYEAAEVALILFHVRSRTFTRRLRKLTAEGFPRPVSRWGRKVWGGQDLLDWLGRPKTMAVDPKIVPFGPALAARARQAAHSGARKTR